MSKCGGLQDCLFVCRGSGKERMKVATIIVFVAGAGGFVGCVWDEKGGGGEDSGRKGGGNSSAAAVVIMLAQWKHGARIVNSSMLLPLRHPCDRSVRLYRTFCCDT